MRKAGQRAFAALAAAVGCALGVTGALAQSLVWDSTSKHHEAERGETNALFRFNVTNTAPSEVVINAVRTSCGCTIAKLPTLPWHLAAGTNGHLEVLADLRGKRGLLSKVISVDSTAGLSLLTVNVQIPEPDPREMNRMLAQADRQAIFRNDCANCHVKPAIGKMGEELYSAACGICHEAEHRAEMVPDLKALNKLADRNYWETWVRSGKPGTLMPAFAKVHGGPLEEDQIASLVDFLANRSRPLTSSDFGDPFAKPGSAPF